MSKASDQLKDKISGAVLKAVQRECVPAKYPAAQPIADTVISAVASEIAHATNNEPWFASRVTIGALAGLVGGSYGLVLDFLDGTLPTPESLTAQVVVIGGAGLALYGRWVARRPIGQ